MPSNVEIKAKVHDLEKLKVKAKTLSGEDGKNNEVFTRSESLRDTCVWMELFKCI